MEDEALEFIVQKLPDGRYLAQSMGACIVTEADDLESLRREICDAVCCHFDEDCKPANVKLRFVEVVREETLEP
jgi:hypothetical protein